MSPVRAVLCLGIALLLGTPMAAACTTAVISGRATPDGRPLLWKNRDAPNVDNEVMLLTGGRYRATAVVNAGSPVAIWMGVNEQGFCIENSLSRDLTERGVKGKGNGGFMRQALLTCATVEDFEELLRSTNGRRSTNANFGVIDAQGGAVLFETSGSEFRRFDANDPLVAPDGYVVRSNFSATAQGEGFDFSPSAVGELYSGGRYLRGCRLMDEGLASESGLTVRYLLQECCRDLADADGKPLFGPPANHFDSLPREIDTASTISRRTSVSAAVFHGVRPGEDPRCTTMWVLLGEPLFSLAVPCWASVEGVAEELDGEEVSPLCSTVRELRQVNYRSVGGDEHLLSHALPAILAETLPVEHELIELAESRLRHWRAHGAEAVEMTRLHRQASAAAMEVVEGLQQASVE
ncbi:carcinine hydrolase/isopenicillin-N N-acyltransferase family protein [Candidatus Laterigemmans baculatus]|uniref:carcinine hydrolase/isopenicillin-N N-acyltransferase family protein n=1 Tax=Candidatus Laterigemmans baculatus TaxID=2770505 RepID=UPI00193BDDF9|nr:carcinine hydrolase/isopenicillin-N N-acyltransferase family protein [Candidatus Laterigemmans baculatus]